MISTIETHDGGASRPRRCASSPLLAIGAANVASMVDEPTPRRNPVDATPQARSLAAALDDLDQTTYGEIPPMVAEVVAAARTLVDAVLDESPCTCPRNGQAIDPACPIDGEITAAI